MQRYEARKEAKSRATSAQAYYCSTGGYGVPVGELDEPNGTNHIDAPDCKPKLTPFSEDQK